MSGAHALLEVATTVAASLDLNDLILAAGSSIRLSSLTMQLAFRISTSSATVARLRPWQSKPPPSTEEDQTWSSSRPAR